MRREVDGGAGPGSESESESEISAGLGGRVGGSVGPIDRLEGGGGEGLFAPEVEMGRVVSSSSERSISSVFLENSRGIVGPIEGPDEGRSSLGRLGPTARLGPKSSSELSSPRSTSSGFAPLAALAGGEAGAPSSSALRLRFARCGGSCGPIEPIVDIEVVILLWKMRSEIHLFYSPAK